MTKENIEKKYTTLSTKLGEFLVNNTNISSKIEKGSILIPVDYCDKNLTSLTEKLVNKSIGSGYTSIIVASPKPDSTWSLSKIISN